MKRTRLPLLSALKVIARASGRDVNCVLTHPHTINIEGRTRFVPGSALFIRPDTYLNFAIETNFGSKLPETMTKQQIRGRIIELCCFFTDELTPTPEPIKNMPTAKPNRWRA